MILFRSTVGVSPFFWTTGGRFIPYFLKILFNFLYPIVSSIEWRAALSLAWIFALRMLGLFILLPILALHVQTQPYYDPLWIGAILGIYGICQAVLQIPFGWGSDRWGRKPVIIGGLILFILGSVLAAQELWGPWGLFIGRALQGCGAISAAIMALLADLTSPEHRTKAMAMTGASIGFSFVLALLVAPGLYQWIGLSGIFNVIGFLALIAIFVLIYIVPQPVQHGRDTLPVRSLIWKILQEPSLRYLYLGIFLLHAAQMGLFVVVPSLLLQQAFLPLPQHGVLYLIAVVASLGFAIPSLMWSEKKRQSKTIMLIAIAFLGGSSVLWIPLITLNGISTSDKVGMMGGLLFLFFIGFNMLEALLPSLVSKRAPTEGRGTALGVYNTMQSLGLAFGGFTAAGFYREWGYASVFLLLTMMMMIWGILLYYFSHEPPMT